MSGVESYLTDAPRHRPRWYGDVGIVAVALVLIALIASTLSWCDFSLQSYRLAAAVPVLLCPGGANAGQVAEGTTVRVTAVYSGSLGQFRELSTGSTVVGWAKASDADAATGVTTSGHLRPEERDRSRVRRSRLHDAEHDHDRRDDRG